MQQHPSSSVDRVAYLMPLQHIQTEQKVHVLASAQENK
jgi:hypothetical protein